MLYNERNILRRNTDSTSAASRNRFELANTDPELSELKYHLLLRKVHIPQGEFKIFTAHLYRNFVGVEVERESVTLVQIMESFDNNLYDIIVGFRRDSEASKVYQTARCFAYNNVQADI